MISSQRATVWDRFTSRYIYKGNGCWEWVGSRFNNGYGRICINYKTMGAHCLSWELHRGKIKKGMFVCHACDNPSCVNPEHLFIGTPKENTHDARDKGRRADRERHPKAKLTWESVSLIRSLPNADAQKLAKKLGVNFSTVYRVRNGKRWKLR